MKLLTKLTLFITFSKILIVLVFVMLLPALVSWISFAYTNNYLLQQQKKVMGVIDKNGLDYYLQGDSTYGSYAMLKEDYISLVPADQISVPDTIETSRRIIEGDTLSYRVLTHNFRSGNRGYVLEIGKTTDTIGQYNGLLQKFTLYTLIGLITLSILIDLLYTNILLRPLSAIVKTKLLNRKFPFKEPMIEVKTSTSDFKSLDNALLSLMEKIHEAFDKEREFTSNASHELMTPVGILQNHLENLLLQEDLPEAAQEKVMGMMKTLNRLKKIVQALLYISRIENEQFARSETVEVQELVNEVATELEPRIEARNIHYAASLQPGVWLKGVNHDLLFQLLYNLINNAIRYNTEGGQIILSDSFKTDTGYTLTVRDTGIGIKDQDLVTIFNRFKKSAGTGEEGYGLGLSIVQSIVQYHQATISVHSVPGEGTSFRIHFPSELVQRAL